MKIFYVDEIDKEAQILLSNHISVTTDPNKADIIYTQLTPYVARNKNQIITTPCTGTSHVKAEKIIYLDKEFKDHYSFGVTSTAEHTISLILQLAKINKIQLHGKKIGILGYGRIGRLVCKYADSFGMTSLLYDKNDIGNMETLQTHSDIITIHIPLDGNIKLIESQFIDKLKDGCLIVNTSRQEVVDIKAINEALQNGKLGGYADDFSNVIKLENYNAIQTSHIAGNSKEARKITDMYIANKIITFCNNLNL